MVNQLYFVFSSAHEAADASYHRFAQASPEQRLAAAADGCSQTEGQHQEPSSVGRSILRPWAWDRRRPMSPLAFLGGPRVEAVVMCFQVLEPPPSTLFSLS